MLNAMINPNNVESVEAVLIEDNPSASIVTTLYDLIAAIQSIVDADDTLAVATVCRILSSGRATWCGDVAQPPSLPAGAGIL
jgi:hypothetical protein